MYPEDLQQQIIAEMVADPEVNWWHDDDSGTWYARHNRENLLRDSTVSRDHAIIWLYHDLRDLGRLRASLTRHDATGAQRGDQTA